MGNLHLSPDDNRGLVIFPAAPEPSRQRPGEEWWLVPVALFLAAAMIALALALR